MKTCAKAAHPRRPNHVPTIVSMSTWRNTSDPFEVAIDGTSQAGDGTLAREYAAAGATWWFEAIFETRGPLEAQIERIKAGPPSSARLVR